MGNWAIQKHKTRDIQSAQNLGFKSLDRSLKFGPLNRPKNSSKDLVRLPISDGIGPRKAAYLWARLGGLEYLSVWATNGPASPLPIIILRCLISRVENAVTQFRYKTSQGMI